MTRFSYAEYLSLFRSNGTSRNSALPKTSYTRECFMNGRAGNPEETPTNHTEGVVPIILAIRRGDVQTVTDLASVSNTETQEDTEDWTPLHEAAHCGQAGCVKALLKATPASVDKRTLQEQTALLIAVEGEHLECVRNLLEAGADPDICSNNKETPLYKACEQECISIVKLLLAFGAAVNQRCHRGWTALHEAVRRNNTELCEILLEARASIDARNTDDITPLIEAAKHGRTKTLAYLIRKGAGVNLQSCDGSTALTEASKHGHADIVKLLLKHHADANKASNAGLLPLHVATQHGHKEIVSLLLPITSRARIRQSGITPLHLAAAYNQQNIMRLLIDSGCDVNTKLSHERSAMFHDHRATALYCAIAARNTQAVALLLKAGANPNIDPLNPLLLAVRQGCFRTIAMLVEYGADVNACPPGQPTDFPGVLLYTHHLGLLQYFLDNGCDAQACFRCDKQHLLNRHHREEGANLINQTLPMNTSSRNPICTKPKLKFCEWISSSYLSHTAGPVINLLLDYVGNVQLCSRMRDLLERRQEWVNIKDKTTSPRPLMHLCRLKIREQVGIQRLMSLKTLPLPDRMIQYLSSKTTSTTKTGSTQILKPGLCSH